MDDQQEANTIPGFDNFDNYLMNAYNEIKQGILLSNNLPKGKTFNYYNTFNDFKNVLKKENDNVLKSMQKLIAYSGMSNKISYATLTEKIELLTEYNDACLDRACKLMDVMDGIRKESSTKVELKSINGSWNKEIKLVDLNPNSNCLKQDENSVTLVASRNIGRPQLFFKDKIDNSNNPWEPKIKEKPNALKPLAILLEMDEDGNECHPYQYELDLFKPCEWQLEKQSIPDINSIVCEIVESEEHLENVVKELLLERKVAVDLEHHSYRSFLGFTCLMQLSTTKKDYIIDTLLLRHKLNILNEVFTKKTILKVFHGSSEDIEWLQKDFGLYVVNMFDTYQASKLLKFPKLSLQFLLNYYCHVESNKAFQLYDWRTRPLSEQALKYAREDTHYLLHIYARMTNDLLELANGKSNLVEVVYNQSTLTCKKRYRKPILDDESHMTLYRRGKKLFDNQQLTALKELYKWRDRIARNEDESINYVLPNHMLMHIAENIPREIQGIMACCNPVPPIVRINLLELHQLILIARSQPLVKIIATPEETSLNTTENNNSQEKLRNLFVHDSSNWEFRDDLPTILDDTLLMNFAENDEKITPKLSLFDDNQNFFKTYNAELVELRNKLKNIVFSSPYERYKQVIPFVNQMEKEKQEKEKKLREQREMERENAKIIDKEIRVNPPKDETENSLPKEKNKNVTLIELVKSEKRKIDQNETNLLHKKNKSNSQAPKQINENSAKNKQTNWEKFQQNVNQPENTNKNNQSRKRNNDNTEDAVIKKQSKEEFKSFDYNNVDFSNRFRGGSNIVKVKAPDSQFKRKRGNIKNKRGGKNFTFRGKQKGKW